MWLDVAAPLERGLAVSSLAQTHFNVDLPLTRQLPETPGTIPQT